MNVHKIGSIEAIALICIVMANQILINIPETIIQSTGSSAWVNVLFISAIAIGFTLLVCNLFEKFSGKDILDICEYVGRKATSIYNWSGISWIIYNYFKYAFAVFFGYFENSILSKYSCLYNYSYISTSCHNCKSSWYEGYNKYKFNNIATAV